MIDPKSDVLWRVYLLYALMLIFSVLVIIKIVLIQTKEKDALLEYAENNELKYRSEYAFRGNVFSKNGTLLATSVPVYNIYFDAIAPHDTIFDKNISKLADSLSNMLRDKSKSKYLATLKDARKNNKRYVKIASKVSVGEYKRMQTFPIFKEGKNRGGFIADKSYVRELPYGILAARTIGYVREKENDSVYVGLEGAFNDYLKGKNGLQMVRRINGGFWMPIPDENNVDPVNGDDIYTSIDIEIQDVAENALKKCLVENDALQGCVVLMDVKSGFVEVMASLSYNEKNSKYEESYNFALRHNVEPGSTFKAVSMLALLENDPSMDINEKIYLGTEIYKVFHRRMMRDSHLVTDEKGYSTIKNAFEQSSNIGLATLAVEAFEDNPDKFIELIYKTKINEPLNLDIKGEAKPDIKTTKDKRWSKLSLPWMSIGYEVMLTPIQILTFYNAIANGGVMVKPQFVKEIRHGNTTKMVFDTIVINERIASEKTIETLQVLLEGVVENGTAAKALNKLGFSVAGKTGTAQISQGKEGYNKKNYTATFVGYFPAEEPKYSCIIVVSNPRGKNYYGSSVSAPVFKEIAEKVYATRLAYELPEVDGQYDCDEFAKASMVYFDDFVDYCNINEIPFDDDSENDVWVKVDDNEEMISASPITVEDDKVPDMSGMNISDAVYLVETMGWKVQFEGYGKVKTQSIKAGTLLPKGKTIKLTLDKK